MNDKAGKIKAGFGIRVRELRQSYEMTQLDLAVKVGIDARNLRRIENGEADPSLSTVYAIASAFEMPVSELLEFKLPK